MKTNHGEMPSYRQDDHILHSLAFKELVRLGQHNYEGKQESEQHKLRVTLRRREELWQGPGRASWVAQSYFMSWIHFLIQ